MIVFKDFFPLALPLSRSLPRVADIAKRREERRRKKAGRGEKGEKSKSRKRSYFAEGHLQRLLLTPSPLLSFLTPFPPSLLKHTSPLSAL